MKFEYCQSALLIKQVEFIQNSFKISKFNEEIHLAKIFQVRIMKFFSKNKTLSLAQKVILEPQVA